MPVSTIPPQSDWGMGEKRAAAEAEAAEQDEDSTTIPDDAEPPSPGGLDPEQAQEEAYNEETGEINWDCPCLENMTKEPCGDKFKAAFSCFVYSKEEPKGVDCIDQFREMQQCFKDHPDIYAAELGDDEDDDEEDEQDAKDAKKDGDKKEDEDA